MSPSVESIIRALYESPIGVAAARAVIPPKSGFYAWWLRPGALTTVPRTQHPSERWDLFYVGIAPGRAMSKATLASRLVGQHIGGNIGSSTFRFSLAALLFEEFRWKPLRRGEKIALSTEDNRALSQWQKANAALQWTEAPEPYRGDLEGQVISRMKPPLNLAGNGSHPFHAELTRARARLRSTALLVSEYDE